MNRDAKPPRRVVVYRVGSLGDTLGVLPAFHLVRQTFPGAQPTSLGAAVIGGGLCPAVACAQQLLFGSTPMGPEVVKASPRLIRGRSVYAEQIHRL